MKKKIFICYRTADEPYAATLIDQVLTPHFGRDEVFRASRSIAVGDDFEEKIFEAVRAASVLLVVIGPNWLDARDEYGRRLDDPTDMVRREIITAFDHGVRVVPVLMNTRRILAEELPVKLAPLAKRQDIRVSFRSSDVDFPALVTRLKQVMAAPDAEKGLGKPVPRSLLVVEDDGETTNREKVARRRVLRALLDEALTSTGITSDKIATETHGDRIVMVVDADLLDVLDTGVEALITALGKHNLAAGGQDWLRPRIAVHYGMAHRDDDGWSGADLTAATALLDVPQVKTVLSRADRAQCALVVSDAVYHQVVLHECGNLTANTYAQLAGSPGWIRVPGYPRPPVETVSDDADPATPSLPTGTNFQNLFMSNAINHIDASTRQDTQR